MAFDLADVTFIPRKKLTGIGTQVLLTQVIKTVLEVVSDHSVTQSRVRSVRAIEILEDWSLKIFLKFNRLSKSLRVRNFGKANTNWKPEERERLWVR